MIFSKTMTRGEIITERKPDFSKAYSNANKILVNSRVISTFPFSPIQLVKEQTPYVCRTYSKAKKYGIDMRDFGSESAVVMSMGDRTIIFYDETKPMTHVGFSILHEAGHPINGHDFHKKDEETYGRYEVETNYFAAQLLMPEQLLRELQSRGVRITVPFLLTNFGVSEPAAQRRINTLTRTVAEWRSKSEREFDDIILMKYAEFLDNICPKRNMFNFEDEYERQRVRDRWY